MLLKMRREHVSGGIWREKGSGRGGEIAGLFGSTGTRGEKI
jgi:hypothetical protein